MPTSNNDIKQEIEKFNQHIQLKDNIPNWFVLQLKTLQSKNITLEDWNKTVTYLQSTASDNNSIQEFLNVLVDDILFWDAIDVYTKGEIDAKLNGKANSVHSHSVSDITDLKKGQANGVASLGSDGRVPSSQLPSYVDDVLEFTNRAAFPQTGEDGKIYIAEDTNKQYRWSGTAYVEISSSLALGETASTAYAGNKGKQNADNIAALQSGKANKVHTHPISDVSNLQETLDRKADYKHDHPASDIVDLDDILERKLDIETQYYIIDAPTSRIPFSIREKGEGDRRIRWEPFKDLPSVKISTSGCDLIVDPRYLYRGVGGQAYKLLDESMALTEEELNAILV